MPGRSLSPEQSAGVGRFCLIIDRHVDTEGNHVVNFRHIRVLIHDQDITRQCCESSWTAVRVCLYCITHDDSASMYIKDAVHLKGFTIVAGCLIIAPYANRNAFPRRCSG
ncbi:hypothetical protein MTO96_002624 [Rhipicephalus appendiculatus]